MTEPSEALKPCDRCGPRAALNVKHTPGRHSWWVQCYGGCRGPRGTTEAEAITAWNTRAMVAGEPVAAPTAATDVAELVEALECLMPPSLCGESWGLPDSETVCVSITFGALREARALLARLGRVEG